MGIIIGIILLIILGVLVISLNGYAFIVAALDGPSELFFRNDSILLKVLFATIALPGVILGTIVGVITFRWIKWW